ncbi:MAG: hypothetical protein WB791_02505 [Waddliaceae bacterium]
MKKTIKIFGKESIDQLPWPNTTRAKKIKKYIVPMIKNSPQYYINNVKTTIQALLVDDLVLPITLNNEENGSSYVCSPHAHYIQYGRQEMTLIKNKAAKAFLESLLGMLGKFLKWGEIDKIIFVNNLLLPTNIHPALTQAQIQAVTEGLIERYPQHAVAFRSMNKIHPPSLLEHLKEEGFRLVISRLLYYTDTKTHEPFQSRMFKSDRKILNQSLYKERRAEEIPQDAIPRIQELYHQLNIEKHSRCNPQFNENFVRLVMDSQWMTIKVLEQAGKIDAALGYFSEDKVMTSPFFGYDTSQPQDLGLYRQISTILLLDAKREGFFLNQSSGSGRYKTLRRAQTTPEYIAVYHQHLPLRRRAPWTLLENVMNRFGKQFLDSYKP